MNGDGILFHQANVPVIIIMLPVSVEPWTAIKKRLYHSVVVTPAPARVPTAAYPEFVLFESKAEILLLLDAATDVR